MRNFKISLIVLISAIITYGVLRILTPWWIGSLKKVDDNVIAIVNGTAISKIDYLDKLKSVNYFALPDIDVAKKVQIKKQVLANMINEILLDQYTKSENLTVTDAEVQEKIKSMQLSSDSDINSIKKNILISKAVKKIVGDQIKFTKEEILEFYERNKDSYTHPELVKISHITVDSDRMARDILKKIHAGDDFVELVKKYSISADATQGGVSEYYKKETLPEYFASAIQMKTNDVSQVIKTSYGYQIFKVLDKKEAGYFDLSEVEKTVENSVRESKEALYYLEWIKGIVGKSLIQKNEILFKKI